MPLQSGQTWTAGERGDGESGRTPVRERGKCPSLFDALRRRHLHAVSGEPSQSGAQPEAVNATAPRRATGMSDLVAVHRTAGRVRTARVSGNSNASPHGIDEATQFAGRAEGGCVTGSGNASVNVCSVPVSSAVLWEAF